MIWSAPIFFLSFVLPRVHLGEVTVLENTGTLVRKTPEEVKRLVETGVYIEIITRKLLCSRKAPLRA